MMKKFFPFILAALFFCFPACALAHSMPDNEMCLEPFAFGTSFQTISSLFGNDYETKEINFGPMRLIWRRYPSFAIQARVSAEDEVDEEELGIAVAEITSGALATRSGYVTMPCGIGVGSAYAGVVKKFGEVPVTRSPGMADVYVYTSATNPGRGISFTVDEAGIITKIRLESEL